MLIHFINSEDNANQFLKEHKMNIKIQIKTLAGSLLFEYEKENNTLKETLQKAVNDKADLRGADLRGADLRGADLRDADLSGADLRGADLRDADLSGADLRGADLRDADLRGADLRGAYLRGAYLRDADLSGADLRGADKAKEDLFKILDAAPLEVERLLEKMKAGQINGSVYQGECACLVGTIANIKKCDYHDLPGIEPNSSRPAERWFLSFKPGATPEKSGKMKETVEWVEEWIEKNKAIKDKV